MAVLAFSVVWVTGQGQPLGPIAPAGGPASILGESFATRGSLPTTDFDRSHSALTRWIPTSTAYTLDPLNATLLQGEINPPSPGYSQAVLDVPSLGEFVVGDSAGDFAYVINASSGHEIRAINLGPPSLQFYGSDPIGFAFNPAKGLLYVSLLGDSSVAFVNLSSGNVLMNLALPGHPYGVVFDVADNQLYTTNDTGVFALNGTTGAEIGFLAIHWGVTPIVIDPLTDTLLTADSGNSTVYVVNISTFSVTTRFYTSHNGGGVDPTALIFDPYTKQVYTADQDGNVSVINAETYQLNATTPEINLGGYPNSLAINPVRHEIYVSSCHQFGFRSCVFYDSNDSVASYTLPNSWPGWLAYDAPTKHLLIDNNNDTLYLFNGSNDLQVGFVPMVTSYLGGVLDPSNGREYVATPALGGVCVLPGTVTVLMPGPEPSFVATVPVGDGPSQVAYDSADDRVFVTNYCSNSVTVIDPTNDSILRASIPVGSEPYGVAYDSLNDTIWIANYNSRNLTVLNGSTLATVRTVTLPQGYPYDLAIDSISQSVFVSDILGNSVTVVNSTTYTISVSSIPVGSSPQGLLYDPQNGDVYVANGGSNNVTVLNAANRSVAGSIRTAGGTTALALDPIDHLVFATDAGGSRIVVIDALDNQAEFPSLPASGEPQGVVYVPNDHQLDVLNFGANAINILANVPTLSNFTAIPAQTEVGDPFAFSVAASNGTPPYAFSYSGLPPGCASADSIVLECTPTLPGHFVVTLTAVDSAGYFWSTSVNVSVWTHLGSGNLSLTPSTIDLGMTSDLVLTGAGGVPPLNYSYQGLPTGCVSSNNSTLSCKPTEAGIFTVVGTVTDNLGVVTVAGTDLVVDPLPQVEAFVANPSTVPVNSSFLLLASVSGGTPPFNYSYDGLPPGCHSSDSTELECVPTVPGSYTVRLTASDSLGESVNGSLPLIILSSPVATPPPQIIAFFADPSTVTIGTNVTLYVIHTGGTPSYSLGWAGLPGGCTANTQTSSTITCRPTQVGNFTLRVNLTDSLGRSVEDRTSLTVLPVEVNAKVPPSASVVSELTLAYVAFAAAAIGGVGGAVVAGLVSRRKPEPAKSVPPPR
ncbi:MAG: YncE family protein [Thermoplasmata archaeon]|nr:YncE family protein [Thermoplasmata archaeon]